MTLLIIIGFLIVSFFATMGTVWFMTWRQAHKTARAILKDFHDKL